MANFNNVVLVGRLTNDPKKIVLEKSGTAKTFGSIAVNRQYKTGDGEKKEETTFVDYFLFGPRAETLEQWAKKGREILLTGYLVNDNWEDKETNEKKYSLKLKVEDFQFIGKNENSSSEDSDKESPSKEKYKNKKSLPY